MAAEERSASVEGIFWDLRAKNDTISQTWLVGKLRVEDWLLVLGHRDLSQYYQMGKPIYSTGELVTRLVSPFSREVRKLARSSVTPNK
jgi:hypothetical protein